MTRETKIGLLVGLAFIIVIGILLSDHLTSSTEPPQATLAVAGNNVRSGVNTPGSQSNSPITSNVSPAPVAPRQTVPTPTDLAPKAQPVQPVQVAVGGPNNVSIGAPAKSQGSEVKISAPETPTQSFVTENHPENRSAEPTNTTAAQDAAPVISKAPPVVVASNDPQPPATPTPAPASNTDIATALREAARQHGEELVVVGGGGASPASSKQTPANTKQYIAAEGDTLSKIAGRMMGSNTKANREAIINANPTLKQNPNIIVSGRTYNIPTSPGVPASAGMTSTPVAQSTTPVIQAPAPVTPSTDNWYTIKEGDTLTKIAMEQCGSGSSVQSIIDLNKDTLKDPNRVVINTKIRLPNKVASAN